MEEILSRLKHIEIKQDETLRNCRILIEAIEFSHNNPDKTFDSEVYYEKMSRSVMLDKDRIKYHRK